MWERVLKTVGEAQDEVDGQVQKAREEERKAAVAREVAAKRLERGVGVEMAALRRVAGAVGAAAEAGAEAEMANEALWGKREKWLERCRAQLVVVKRKMQGLSRRRIGHDCHEARAKRHAHFLAGRTGKLVQGVCGGWSKGGLIAEIVGRDGQEKVGSVEHR